MRKSKDTLTIGAIFFHVNVPLNYPKRASTSLEVAGNQISFLCSHLVLEQRPPACASPTSVY